MHDRLGSVMEHLKSGRLKQADTALRDLMQQLEQLQKEPGASQSSQTVRLPEAINHILLCRGAIADNDVEFAIAEAKLAQKSWQNRARA
jgi:hypothetical protein